MNIPVVPDPAHSPEDRRAFHEVSIALIQRYRAGDLQAGNVLFNNIYARYWTLMYRKCDNDPELTAELMQEVCLILARVLGPGGGFDPDKSQNVLGYLSAVVDSTFRNYWRKLGKRTSINPDSDEIFDLASIHPIPKSNRWQMRTGRLSQGRTADEIDFCEHVAATVSRIIDAMPPRNRDILELRLQGQDLEDIGHVVLNVWGTSSLTKERIRQILVRSVKMLRDELLEDSQIHAYCERNGLLQGWHPGRDIKGIFAEPEAETPNPSDSPDPAIPSSDVSDKKEDPAELLAPDLGA